MATIVCEASSFQLEDSSAFAPEAAVLLNIAEDHLDRHGNLADYRDAKLRIFANQEPSDLAVVHGSLDLPPLRARTVRVPEELSFNRANETAAATVCTERGIDPEAVRAALREFPGVPHRFETVRELDGVTYVNDSKATNPSAAAAALRSFDKGVHVILGGSLKGGSFEGLPTDSIRTAYLIGEAAGADRRGAGGLGHRIAYTPATSSTRSARRRGARGPARSCCSRPRVRASTSTATTRNAASTSRPWCGGWRR